ncbi:hypothetical protein L7F22_049229 [Adiantum nelumboides]|nr:hypothetical protein [Adiantum nelumboides]
MLTVCGRPHSYWEEAISTACYLQNRIFTTALPNQTPYFRWFGHKPDLSHTRIFGCDAYAVSTDPHRGKLDHKAISTIFVGYGERFGHKAYRLYDPIGKRFLFSRSVIFDELQLLKGNTATSSPTLSSPIDSIHAHDSTAFTKSSSIPLLQPNSNLLHNPSLPFLPLPSPSSSTNDSHNSTFELPTSPSLQASSSSDPLPTPSPPPRMMRSLADIYAQTNAISCTPPAEPEFPDPILVDDGELRRLELGGDHDYQDTSPGPLRDTDERSRFVELLWQLSAHALREVHKRSFPGDVLSNPLPPSLTEVVAQINHASALLTVTKARIAVERRRFLDSASGAVRRQGLWSTLAHDMTAEYRALCAEEAYLNQELDKVQDARNNKESLFRDSQSGFDNAPQERKLLSLSKASLLWDSLMNQTAQHEKLASGPIEDLIAHREHRYRVSGPALRAAMERSSSGPLNELGSLANEEAYASQIDSNPTLAPKNLVRSQKESAVVRSVSEVNEESRLRGDERGTKASAPLDVAEILRRWTHSLQTIHKQALRMARANDGIGPDLIKEALDANDNGHAQALRATLAEHKQHLANIQVLIKQLKESMPGMESSIANLREQLSRTIPPMISASTLSSLSDRVAPLREASVGQGAETVVKAGTCQLELVPPSPALKLPQIFSLSQTSMGRTLQSQRSRTPTQPERVLGALSAENAGGQASVQNSASNYEAKKEDNLASLRQAVHEAALSSSKNVIEEVAMERSEFESEHFFTPVVSDNPSEGVSGSASVTKCLQESLDRSSQEYNRYESRPLINGHKEDVSLKQAKVLKPAKCLSYNGLSQNGTSLSNPEMLRMNAGSESIANEMSRPFSPPLLTDLSAFSDTFDDLLRTDDFELSDVALEGVWFNPAM